ncbi:MAG: hypothetical protein ABIG93_01730 [archaeon]|nr:hypothetical protein [Nanoarchaeota archaeon]
MNKKGMVEDLFDYLFIVITVFIALAFIGFLFDYTLDERKETTLDNLEKTNERTALITESRADFEDGKDVSVTDLRYKVSRAGLPDVYVDEDVIIDSNI